MPLSLSNSIFIYPYYYMNENPFFVRLKTKLEHRGISTVYIGHSLKNAMKILEVEKLKSHLVADSRHLMLLCLHR